MIAFILMVAVLVAWPDPVTLAAGDRAPWAGRVTARRAA